MLAGGFKLAIRTLTFPAPVVMAKTGPAIAMGSFLLLSGDHRVGRALPAAGQRGRHRDDAAGGCAGNHAGTADGTGLLACGVRAAVLRRDAAVAGGWLDEIVERDAVLSRAQEVAAKYATTLHLKAHVESKLKAQSSALAAIRPGSEQWRPNSRCHSAEPAAPPATSDPPGKVGVTRARVATGIFSGARQIATVAGNSAIRL